MLRRLLDKRAIATEDAVRLAGSRANLDRLTRAGIVRPNREGHEIELAVSRDEAVRELAEQMAEAAVG